MEIKDIIKETQPDVYSKLKTFTKSTHKKEKLTGKDIKELMGHSSYKRHGGAIRQVR